LEEGSQRQCGTFAVVFEMGLCDADAMERELNAVVNQNQFITLRNSEVILLLVS
jgi:hypothetical protein